MEPLVYKLTRDVTKDECTWLNADLAKGTVVYKYPWVTYGCISPSGRAVSLEIGGPFLELPRDALMAAE
jgi:hypothetical protein